MSKNQDKELSKGTFAHKYNNWLEIITDSAKKNEALPSFKTAMDGIFNALHSSNDGERKKIVQVLTNATAEEWTALLKVAIKIRKDNQDVRKLLNLLKLAAMSSDRGSYALSIIEDNLPLILKYAVSDREASMMVLDFITTVYKDNPNEIDLTEEQIRALLSSADTAERAKDFLKLLASRQQPYSIKIQHEMLALIKLLYDKKQYNFLFEALNQLHKANIDVQLHTLPLSDLLTLARFSEKGRLSTLLIALKQNHNDIVSTLIQESKDNKAKQVSLIDEIDAAYRKGTNPLIGITARDLGMLMRFDSQSKLLEVCLEVTPAEMVDDVLWVMGGLKPDNFASSDKLWQFLAKQPKDKTALWRTVFSLIKNERLKPAVLLHLNEEEWVELLTTIKSSPRLFDQLLSTITTVHQKYGINVLENAGDQNIRTLLTTAIQHNLAVNLLTMATELNQDSFVRSMKEPEPGKPVVQTLKRGVNLLQLASPEEIKQLTAPAIASYPAGIAVLIDHVPKNEIGPLLTTKVLNGPENVVLHALRNKHPTAVKLFATLASIKGLDGMTIAGDVVKNFYEGVNRSRIEEYNQCFNDLFVQHLTSRDQAWLIVFAANLNKLKVAATAEAAAPLLLAAHSAATELFLLLQAEFAAVRVANKVSSEEKNQIRQRCLKSIDTKTPTILQALGIIDKDAQERTQMQIRVLKKLVEEATAEKQVVSQIGFFGSTAAANQAAIRAAKQAGVDPALDPNEEFKL